MMQNQFNTNSRKGKHLSLQERTVIQEKHREGLTNRQIATYMNRAPQTINNELNRRTTTQKRKQTQNGKDKVSLTEVKGSARFPFRLSYLIKRRLIN